MAKAIAARMDGDDYQARWFWIKACELLEPHTFVERVAFEDDTFKSVDDVVVYYRSGTTDSYGTPRTADFYQVKFHVSQGGAIRAEALIDPKFINAESVSLLKRVHNAYISLPKPEAYRFILYTPWDAHPDDVLAAVIHNRDRRVNWDRLAQGGPGTKTGKVREAWKEHLGLMDDEDLRKFLAYVYFERGYSLVELGNRLNERLSSVGLKPKDPACTNSYDALAHDLVKEGITYLDKGALEKLMKARGLWDGGPRVQNDRIPLGIRSRMQFAEDLENKVKHICCVSGCFSDRAVNEQFHWHQSVFPSISGFVKEVIEPGGKYLLHLEAHTTIAFATGYCLPSKAGVDVAVVQKSFSGGQSEWMIPNQLPSDEEWAWEEEVLSSGSSAVALGVSITHEILPEVKEYVRSNLPEIGRILVLRPLLSPGSSALRDAGHAAAMAQSLLQRLRKENLGFSKDTTIHLFSAAPNAFMFFLGRFVSSVPHWVIYEYDFERQRDGGYTPSLRFPVPDLPTQKESTISIALERGI